MSLLQEPLHAAVDHPDHCLTSSDDRYDILPAVERPDAGLVVDSYH